jgi:hypothetical protein
MCLKGIWRKVIEIIHVAQDRDDGRALVNTVMSIYGSMEGGKLLDQLSSCYLLMEDSAP